MCLLRVAAGVEARVLSCVRWAPLTVSQNRELQIMRIVRHPNIVELKAFYYSNGDRVSRLSLSWALFPLSSQVDVASWMT